MKNRKETKPAQSKPVIAKPQARLQSALASRWLKVTAISLVSALGVTAIVWAIGATMLMHFQIGGQSYSARLSDAELKQKITASSQSYKLGITSPTGKTTYYPTQTVGINVDVNSTVDLLKRQQRQISNELKWWQPVKGSLSVSVNPTALNTFITSHGTTIIQPAQDATLAMVNGNVQLSDATAGKEYGLKDAAVTITNAVADLQNKPLQLQTLALNPVLSDQELASSKVKLQKVLQQKITFTIGSETITPNAGDISNWLELTPEPKTHSVDIAVNSGKVLEYLNNVAAEFIRPSKAEVDIAQADGSTTVLVPGENGIDIVDKNSVATQIAQSVLNGSGMQINMPVNAAPFETIQAGDYDKWFDVDLTNHIMYAYEHGTLVKTFLISAGAPATPTVVGNYTIYAKYTSQDMYGENVDGSSYYQPNVPWVNYFYKDYAIHGNYWRPLSYFGNINSSHGCVGVTPSDGAWIYSWAGIGTHVITHA